MSITISVVLDTRRLKLSNNKYPVKLRVTHERAPEYYQTVFDLTKRDWEKLTSPRLKDELQTVRRKLQDIERDAFACADNIQPFTFQQFENLFIKSNPLIIQRKKKSNFVCSENSEFDFKPFYRLFPILLEKPGSVTSVSFTYIKYIKQLLLREKIGTATNYQGSYLSLKKFRGDVLFTSINVSYLIEYENWLRSRNVSRTTIGIYIRPLRAIFNQAITDKIISKENHYPFGRHKYIIPSSKGRKKALLISDIEKIFFYEAEDNLSRELEAKDYWLFSYFGNGINPKDIANLKFKNIEGDYIIFERAKTEYSQRNDPNLLRYS